MNREYEDVIELGAVSTDTKGGAFVLADSEQTLSLPIGLSDD
jgi:hypothetical protein